MLDLPTTYVSHLVSPRGLGDVTEPHAAGEVGSMVGGLGVRVTLSYRSDPGDTAVIADVRGRAFGSNAAIAPLSWLMEVTRGQTWDEACRHSAEEVVVALGDGASKGQSLPEPVRRASEFAVKALRRALGIARHGMPADLTGQGILVCRCLGVGDRRIRRAIIAGARDPEAVGEDCHACTGCRSCRPDVLALIDEEVAAPWPEPAADLHPVARIALARGGPMLRALGMPLLGARVVEDTVHVRLGAPAPGAAISPLGAVAQLHYLLRETVHDGIRVEAAPDAP